MKMKKREKKSGGEGGCVQRIEVIVKRKKVRRRVRVVDVNGEVKLL